MHAYANNCAWNHRLVGVLMLVSASIAAAISWLLSWIGAWLGLSIGGASALAVFGLLFWWFDNHLWKHPNVRSLLLVPDLNGSWDCVGIMLTNTGEETSVNWSATISIVQSWSKIRVVQLRQGMSDSVSRSASIYHEPGHGFRLIYYYDNTPDATRPDLRRHSGLSDLIFNEEVSTGTGTYFTDRERMTSGTMKLTRKNGASNEQVAK